MSAWCHDPAGRRFPAATTPASPSIGGRDGPSPVSTRQAALLSATAAAVRRKRDERQDGVETGCEGTRGGGGDGYFLNVSLRLVGKTCV